jgi:hypothetical protein
MLRSKSREELVRLAWLTKMRRHPELQCVGAWDGDKMCAMALLGEMIGNFEKTSCLDSHKVGAAAGLTRAQVEAVIDMNDRQNPLIGHTYTFPMIADEIERWFAKPVNGVNGWLALINRLIGDGC